jgi:hypothetical protein
MRASKFDQTAFFKNLNTYNKTVSVQEKLKLPETLIMSLSIALGLWVVIVGVIVLYRSCYLSQKKMYVALTSLIIVGTVSGVCAVCCWRMFAVSVGKLPKPTVDVFSQCNYANYSSIQLCGDFVFNLT